MSEVHATETGTSAQPAVAGRPPVTVAYQEPGVRQPSRRSAGVYIAVAAALLAGLAAGVVGHDRIAHLLGRHAHADGAAGKSGKKSLWTCSMHPQVLKDGPGMCPICHMKLEPLDVVQSGQSTMGGGGAAGGNGGGGRRIAYWWDPMAGSASIADAAGKNKDGVDLLPVYEDEVSAGTAVRIDPVVVQNMGVRVAAVSRGPVRRDVRAVGTLEEAHPLVRDVNLRVSGWVEKLYADTEGKHLNKGDPLFDLYSPEAQVALEELVAARKGLAALGPAADELARGTSSSLLEAARRKLELWGLDPEQVERLSKMEQAPRTITFTSPITGHVTRKMVVEGAAVKAGDAALQIVDHSTLWLDARVYAQDLPFVRLGQKVSAAVEGVPGRRFEGEVVFVHPHVDPQTRTATVRTTVPNPEMALRPGMFATAHLSAQAADDAVLVPREAVIDTGSRQVAFTVASNGHFEPRRLKLGTEGGDGAVQVLEGLAPGEMVVTSGQFLLDAESRMREAVQKHMNERLLAATPPAPPPGKGHAVAGGAAKSAAGADTGGSATAVPATQSAGGAERVTWSPELDGFFDAYLKVQKVLGAPQPAGAQPVDAGGLVRAARALADRTVGDRQRLPAALLDAASALVGKSLDQQRALFKPLSDAAIALAEAGPPSKAVADKLHVAYCPMAFDDKGGQWLQVTDAIANPYYATEMKRCGEVTRAVETVAAPAR